MAVVTSSVPLGAGSGLGGGAAARCVLCNGGEPGRTAAGLRFARGLAFARGLGAGLRGAPRRSGRVGGNVPSRLGEPGAGFSTIARRVYAWSPGRLALIIGS